MGRTMRIAMAATALGAGLALGACHKTGSNAGKDLTKPSDSAAVNTVQDVAAGPTGMASAVVVGPSTTAEYVKSAGIADMYEIQAAKIAEARTKSPKVKAMAAMLVADHTTLSKGMKDAIAANHIPVAPPTALDDRRTGMINNLKASGDSDFDGAYLHQQAAAHLEALTLHKGFAARGDNDALKGVANTAVPVIEKHLDMIKDAAGADAKAAIPG